MAKRKRLISPTSRRTKRRPEAAEVAVHPHGEVDYDKEYKVRDILDEKGAKYLVDWEDDSETGEKYEPTWEPKKNVNDLAVVSWIKKQAAKPSKVSVGSKSTQSSQSTPQGSASKRPRREPAPPRSTPRRKPIRVIDSSPTDNTTSVGTTQAASTFPQLDEDDSEIVIGESQQTEGAAEAEGSSFEPSLVTPAQSPSTKSRQRLLSVQASDPPSSFLAGAYERVDDSSTQSATQTTSRPSSDLIQVVPESQSQAVESAFRGFSPASISEDIPEPSSHPGDEDGSSDLPVDAGNEQSHPGPSEAEAIEAAGPEEAEGSTQRLGIEDDSRDRRVSVEPPSADKLRRTDHINAAEISASVEDSAQHHDLQTPLEASVPSVTREENHLDQNGIVGTTNTAVPASSERETSHPSFQAVQTRSASQQTYLSEPSQFAEYQDNSHRQGEPHSASQYSVPGRRDIPSQVERITVNSSTDLPTSSLGIYTQPNCEPPPAGQRLPESSLCNDETPSRPESEKSQATVAREPGQSAVPELETPASHLSQQPGIVVGSTQSSFPFQTQLPHPPRTPLLFDGPNIEARDTSRQLHSPINLASARNSPSQESSPVPSIPAYSLATLGESAPAALSTPSQSLLQSPLRSTMEPSYGRSTKELVEARMKEKIAARKASRMKTPTLGSVAHSEPASALPANISAEVAASQAARLSSPALTDGARSPSAVPAVEAIPFVTKEEMNTSGRYGTLLPQALANSTNGIPTNPATSNPSSVQDAARDRETANVHIVSVPLGSHQRDQYVNYVYYHEEITNRFLEHDPASAEDTAAAEMFLDKLRDIAMHPDIVIDETASQKSSAERQAQWDIDISSKFRFLRDLITHLRSTNIDLHVTIAAKGYKVPAMVSTFLQGLHISHVRLAKPTPEQDTQNTSGLKISVLDLDNNVEHVSPADIVVAMDGSVDCKDRLLQAARHHAKDDRWAPLIKLAVPYTVEHIESCLLPSMTAAYRLRVLIKNAKRFRYVAGRSDEECSPASVVATAVLESLSQGNASDWPLAELGPIEDLDSQTDTDVGPESNGSMKQPEETPASGQKRPLELDLEMSTDDSVKRQRAHASGDDIQFPATINPHDVDITHISDSLGQGTQSAFEFLSSGLVGTESQLRAALNEVQNRLEEHVKALEDLQYRHEDQRTLLVTTQRELADALAVAQTAVQRRTASENQNAELRVERSALKQQLEEANKKLLDHANPERREFEALRLQLEEAVKARAKAEKRVELTQKDLEWARGMYQESSSKAQELAQQTTELETSLAQSRVLASGETARARQISQQSHNKLLEKENEKLKRLLEDRNAGLKFRDEEIARLKEAGRGRMGTRGNSVPRSPRVGSPLKGRTSRQTSPAAGDGRSRGSHLHPLRNG